MMRMLFNANSAFSLCTSVLHSSPSSSSFNFPFLALRLQLGEEAANSGLQVSTHSCIIHTAVLFRERLAFRGCMLVAVAVLVVSLVSLSVSPASFSQSVSFSCSVRLSNCGSVVCSSRCCTGSLSLRILFLFFFSQLCVPVLVAQDHNKVE
mgnify:CR=1 FL=1